MKTSNYIKSIGLIFLLSVTFNTYAQTNIVSLDNLLDSLQTHSTALRLKQYSIDQKSAAIDEAKIKKYPTVVVNSAYQYNVNVGQLEIPKGTLGQLPLAPNNEILLPNSDLNFPLGTNHTFNAGIAVYQPLTQLGKIQSGIELAKLEQKIAGVEKDQVRIQLNAAVEQLYYGILVSRKRQEEANKKIEVAKLQLYDVEGAQISGKSIEVNSVGLKANIANEEQKLLQLKFEEQDYIAELMNLTGVDVSNLSLAEPVMENTPLQYEILQQQANLNNIDIQISKLRMDKAAIGVKVAQQSNLPDIGLLAGYTYQLGSAIFPKNNPFIGASLKWNIQDLLSNRSVLQQRKIQAEQAAENSKYIQEQTSVAIQKAYRKWQQAKSLIEVAQKAVGYRKEALKIEEDKKIAGMNTPIQILNAEALLAKAEADLYAAYLNERITLVELNKLTNGAVKP